MNEPALLIVALRLFFLIEPNREFLRETFLLPSLCVASQVL